MSSTWQIVYLCVRNFVNVDRSKVIQGDEAWNGGWSQLVRTMSLVTVDDDRRFDDYTPRLRFNAPSGYYVQSQYHISDAAGTDCRTFCDAASCDSSRTCTCCSIVDAESSKTPADAGCLPHHFQRNDHHDHHQQQQQPASFAIHQLLGLGADIRNIDISYGRHLTLETIDSRHHPHVTPPTPCRCTDCAQSFNPDVDASLSSPNCPGSRGSHQLDLPYCDPPTSASVAAYHRQHHGSTGVGATRWSYLRAPLQIPPPLTPWSSDQQYVPKKSVHHHLQQQHQQESQHHYDELQAYCAARLQPRSVMRHVTSCDSVIRQCHINYLPSNLGM